MTSSESDPVVRSYEVFVSQALNDQLFVLQYPTRPAYLPFNPNLLEAAKVKPKQIRVQLEYQVPVPNDPSRFCPIKSQQQALEHSPDHLETHKPSYILSSESGEASGDRYAVAVLKDRTLHLNPLHAVIQLRADSHLKAQPTDQLSKDSVAEIEEGSEEIVPLQMRAPRPSANQQRASLRRREREHQEEGWVGLTYNQFESGMAGYLRSLLFGDVEGDRNVCKPVSNEEYLEQLAHVSRKVEPPSTPVDTQTLLDRRTRNKPIKEQLLHTLKKTAGNCVKFSFVQELLGNQFSPENLLKTLEQIAMLVQGWFVLNSSELYPASDTSSPVDPLQIQRGRDYIICHYALYKTLNKQDTFDRLKLPIRQFNEVFGSVSRFYLRNKHNFKYAEDSLFIKEHQALSSRHLEHWNEVYEKIRTHFKLDPVPFPKEVPLSNKGSTSPIEIVSDGMSAPLTKKPRPATSIIDPSTVRQLLGQSPMPLSELKRKVFQVYKKIKQENKSLASLFKSPELFDGVMHTILQEINAALIHFPASSGANNSIMVVARETGSDSDVYRMALISSLQNRPSQRKQELMQELKKSIGSLPDKKELDRILESICDVTGSMYMIKGLDS